MDAWLQVLLVLSAAPVADATVTTPNFVVTAPTQEIAEQVGEAAEFYRKDLAEKWLGEELKRWYRPCPIQVRVGHMGAGGATSFSFDRGHVFGWRMTVNGSLERVLDSVLPHEISHTIFASHFRRPLPRWADEGAASLVEHDSERLRLQKIAEQALQSGRRIPLTQLLEIKEYPQDMQDTLTLYAEGYLLANFLVQRGGRKRFLEFMEFAHQNNWEQAFARYYDIRDLSPFEAKWQRWIMAGSPTFGNNGQVLAANEAPSRPQPDVMVRGQSPEPSTARPDRPAPGRAVPSKAEPSKDRAVAANPRSRLLEQPALRLPNPRVAASDPSPDWDAWNNGWQPTNRIRRELAKTGE